MQLSSQDFQHLTVAEGYAELGMFLDANAELEEIDAEVRHVPEVLEVRVQICRDGFAGYRLRPAVFSGGWRQSIKYSSKAGASNRIFSGIARV